MATFTFAGTGNSSNLFVWLKVSASASYVKISPVAIVDSSTSSFSVDLEDFLVDNVGSTVADIYNTHKGSEPSDYPVFRIANTDAGNSELKMANLVDGATYDVDGAITTAGPNNASVALTGATQTPSFSGSAPSGSSTKTKVRAADQLNIELDDGTSTYATLDDAIAAGAVTPGNLETALLDAGALKVGWSPAELDDANVDEAIVNYGYIKQINASLDSLESNVASDIADSLDSLELAEDQVIASVDSLETVISADKAELDASVDSLEGADSSLETVITGNKTELDSSVSSIDTRMSIIQGSDQALDTFTELVQYVESLDDIDGVDIVNLGLSVDSLETVVSADKAELDASVDSLEGADSSLETVITNNKSELDASVDSMETVISADKAELDASVDSLEGADSSLETVITNNKTELDASVDSMETVISADKAELDASVDSLEGADSSLETVITNNKSELDASVDSMETVISADKAELDASVDSMETVITGNKTELDASVDSLETAISTLVTNANAVDFTEVQNIGAFYPAGTYQFTLAGSPVVNSGKASILVAVNGLVLDQGTDYTISGDVVTLQQSLFNGDKIIFKYTIALSI